jgi:agmatinase
MREAWFGLAIDAQSQENADLAIFGIPFDGAVFFRKGAAEGPGRIKDLSSKLPPVAEDGRVLDHMRIRDLPDVSPGGDRERFFAEVRERFGEARSRQIPLALGGDHSVSIPLFEAADAWAGGDYGLIWIDAHPDLCDLYDGSPFSHACVLRRALEGPNLHPGNVVMLGVRSCEVDEIAFIEDMSLDLRSSARLAASDAEQVGRELVERFRDLPVYLSIDIDAFDPAYAPGTGIPDAGGLSTRWVLDLLHALYPLDLLAIDIVEVAPPLDTPSDATSLLALKLIVELLANLDRRADFPVQVAPPTPSRKPATAG